MLSAKNNIPQWAREGGHTTLQPLIQTQKLNQLRESYKQIHGKEYEGPKVMADKMQLSRKWQVFQAKEGNRAQEMRFATEMEKMEDQLTFDNLKSFSRFYTGIRVEPETIAADVGASAFSNAMNNRPSGDSDLITANTVWEVRSASQNPPLQQTSEQEGKEALNLKASTITASNMFIYDSFI